MNKNQLKYLGILSNKYGNDPDENIYPKPMTDREFVEFISKYLLGENYLVVDPLSEQQINVIRARDIIYKFKGGK